MPFVTDDTDSHANADGIADAMGGLLDTLNSDDAISDELLDSELEAKHATPETDVTDDAETVVDPAEKVEKPVIEEDPLKDAPSLTYVVDGQQKNADWIKVYTEKDGTVRGAIVTPDQIPALQQRLSRADYYETQNKVLYEKTQQYERVGGIEAMQNLTTENAKLSEVVKLFSNYLDFDNPTRLIELAQAALDGNKQTWDSLIERTKFIAERAAFDAQKKWGTQVSQHSTQQAQLEQRSETTTRSIASSVEHWSKQHPQLTADDKAKAIAHLTRIGSAVVRPSTPEEARAVGLNAGDLIIDHPVVAEYLAERAELRAATARDVQAKTAANAENAKRLQAAARGNTLPKKKTATGRAAPVEPEGETWAQQKERLQGGNFSSIEH